VTLLPECLDDFIAQDNPVRVVDAFVAARDLAELEFQGVVTAATGRPSYHPTVLLKIYIYGHLNRIQSSRRLERECQRSLELMWLSGRPAPDFKTIADFRRDNSRGIRYVCRRFVELCRELKLFSQALVAIDGSKFKAVNSRDRNFTPGKIDKRREQIEHSIQRYLDAVATADRTQPVDVEAKTERPNEKIEGLRQRMQQLDRIETRLKSQAEPQLSLTDPDARSMSRTGKGTGTVGYNVQIAVEARHHLILAHEVTNVGHDRAQLHPMAQDAREAMGKTRLKALAYLSRYTHRVAISNSRLIAMDEHGVTFRWKDHRVKNGSEGRTRHKTMTLDPGVFMRRFLLHVLPGGFHQIRHFGLLANGRRKASLALVRELLHAPAPAVVTADGGHSRHSRRCSCAGAVGGVDGNAGGLT
jgi:transposase